LLTLSVTVYMTCIHHLQTKMTYFVTIEVIYFFPEHPLTLSDDVQVVKMPNNLSLATAAIFCHTLEITDGQMLVANRFEMDKGH